MKKLKTTILLFLPAIIWGFSFVAQTKSIESGIGAFTFNAVKYIIGTVFLIPFVLISDRRNRERNTKQLILSGFIAGVFLFSASFFQQYGIEVGVNTDVPNITGVAGFITGIYIIIIPVIRFCSGKKTNITTLIGAVFAAIGLYFLCVTNGLGSITKAHFLLFGCAVLFALQIIAVDKFAGKFSAVKFSIVQFATVAILSLICAFIFEEPSIGQVKCASLPVLYSGILSVGVAYTCQTIAQKDADPTFAGIVFSTESVFSAIGGALILHEIMTGRGYFGCALIFAGIIISQLEFKSKSIKHNKNSKSPDNP